ncbi:MAG: hypothetical protein QGI21_03315 [Candidatus Poseidoniaceae archaeon]|jgi:hypothetical protein|nr:hypothetical protein [Candidatus Poseidoniaceae archaeon]
MVKVIHRVRYPPFESKRILPEFIEAAEHEFEVEGATVPPFIIGKKSSWMLERIVEGDHEIDCDYHGDPPQIISAQRTGWYLTPNPIHAKTRKFMVWTVVVLLTCLFYLFTVPIQDSLGLPTFGTGKIRLGLLDYPVLAVIVVPLMLTPIILRAGANFSDLNRQRLFLKDPPQPPEIKLSGIVSGKPLKGEISIPEVRENWTNMKISWRVGVLPPARHKVFKMLGRDIDGQPPPGLTTPLPHHWEKGLDDGTGMGEDSPMQNQEATGGVFLRPMRMMGRGGNMEMSLEGGKFSLEPPRGKWPGTIYGDLVRVHWEAVLSIHRSTGGTLLWVLPITVKHSGKSVVNDDVTIYDGRSESDAF